MRMHVLGADVDDVTSTDPQHEGMLAELKWVHSMIRRDLETVRELAQAVRDGLPPFEIDAAIRSLATNGPLWQLKVNCLRYCHFVELHHRLESAALFPAVRARVPDLGPVIDKLEADHQVVAGHLDDVEAAIRALGAAGRARGAADGDSGRGDLIAALERLAADLLTHLDFEEESLGPTLRTWTRL
jgi:hypothetical protein